MFVDGLDQQVILPFDSQIPAARKLLIHTASGDHVVLSIAGFNVSVQRLAHSVGYHCQKRRDLLEIS